MCKYQPLSLGHLLGRGDNVRSPSHLVGSPAKAKDLTFKAKDFDPQGRVHGIEKCYRCLTSTLQNNTTKQQF